MRSILAFACAAIAVIAPAAASAQDIAPGQSKADYYAWLAQSQQNRENVLSFKAFLRDKSVEDVLPVWQLVRTSSSWRECGAEPFEVAERGEWPNIVETLDFVKDEVRPAIGPVEAVSAFRNARLNGCSRGAPLSAHRLFFAVDLVPAGDIDRGKMITQLCTAFAERGSRYHLGLGFYSRTRFHVDSNGFRKWGADGRGATSPCNGNIA